MEKKEAVFVFLKKNKLSVFLATTTLIPMLVLLWPNYQTRRSLWLHIKHHPVFLDEEQRAVVERAEKEFVLKFGSRVLDQRPWQLHEENGIYRVSGTFHRLDSCGGVAEIEIRKSDGEILLLYHSL